MEKYIGKTVTYPGYHDAIKTGIVVSVDTEGNLNVKDFYGNKHIISTTEVLEVLPNIGKLENKIRLATKIRESYDYLKRNPINKEIRVTWNQHIGTGISEISVVNDAGFKAIIIGDTRNVKESRGYMYLFYSNDDTEKFPSISEILRRLQIVANKEILSDSTVAYHDWQEYGSLEKQREYFAEIINRIYVE